MAKLAPYRAKRDFTKTSEPPGLAPERPGFSFVVQKHAARRLHYDFRLELDGVLKSWAVAKGPSLVAGDKRLAVHVEDHPVAYGGFEGTIPAGQYGGGTVLLWDRGTWEPEGDPRQGYAKGHLVFRLHGERLKGGWHLVRMRRKPRERQESWLLIKSEDGHARPAGAPDILESASLSVATGRSLEEIARGERRKAAAKPKTGRKTKPAPLPRDVKPCLATPVDMVPKGAQWLHEIKWDGYRLIASVEGGKARLVTRNGLDWTKRFPGIAEAVAALPVENAILDGEAVMEDENGVSNFSLLQQALSLTSRGIADRAILYAFDLLHLDGEDLRPLPLQDRKARLADLVARMGPGSLRFSEHLDADGEAMVRNACRLGLEGVVSKRRDKPYRSGRGEDWVKTKCTERQEFVIAGYVPSSASAKAVGSLVLGYHEAGRLVHAGRTGTGFTAEIARELFKKLQPLRRSAPPFDTQPSPEQRRGAVWVRPELLAEVEFRGWTAERSLRHAAFKGLREDKEPQEVVREGAMPRATKSAKAKSSSETEVAGVRLTHPDRVLWDDTGLTKRGLAEFYQEIAPWILPHIAGRPLSLVRCPSGVQGGCFFQKHSWAGLSEHVRRETVRDEKGENEILFVDDIRGVIGLVQAGVLEIHPWGSTLANLEQPDRLIFDFDPSEDVSWGEVIAGARELRDRLQEMGLESWPKTTGGKGLHVVVPLAPEAGWDAVKAFSREVAEAMEADNPRRYLTKSTKSERGGRIFIDYLRNAREATAVAAYSTRARTGAPVSAPLTWDELSEAVRSNHYRAANLLARLGALRQDPWAGFWRAKQRLPAAKAKKPRRR